MGELNHNSSWKRVCVSLRILCYLAVLYNIAVFAVNVIFYIKDRSSWQNDSNADWVRWQWVDLAISAISIVVAILLYSALLTNNRRLIEVFLIWTVLCIVVSALVLGFGFGEFERGQILARCVGIVASAYFADVVFSFYLKLKESGEEASRRSPDVQSYTLQPIAPEYTVQPDMINGGFFNEEEMFDIEPQNYNVRNVRLWYEDTKL